VEVEFLATFFFRSESVGICRFVEASRASIFARMPKMPTGAEYLLFLLGSASLLPDSGLLTRVAFPYE
jgi:hypothetical protein